MSLLERAQQKAKENEAARNNKKSQQQKEEERNLTELDFLKEQALNALRDFDNIKCDAGTLMLVGGDPLVPNCCGQLILVQNNDKYLNILSIYAEVSRHTCVFNAPPHPLITLISGDDGLYSLGLSYLDKEAKNLQELNLVLEAAADWLAPLFEKMG